MSEHDYEHGIPFASVMHWVKTSNQEGYALFGRWKAMRIAHIVRIGWITTGLDGTEFTLSVATYCPWDNSMFVYENENSYYFEQRQRCVEEAQVYCKHHNMLCMGVPLKTWVQLTEADNAGVTRLASKRLGVKL